MYDAADAPEAALSVAVSPDGAQLAAGLDRRICLFDPGRPGREYSVLSTRRRREEGLAGLVGTLAFSPTEPGILAAGCYAGGAALYDARARAPLCLLLGTTGAGVSLVRFSADGNFVYTGCRGRGGAIQCWDVRGGSGVLYSIPRTCHSYQRLEFCIAPSGRHLAAGDGDGHVRWFDLRDGSEVGGFAAAADTVNGLSMHPFLPLLATATGQRRLPGSDGDASDSESEMSDSESEAAEDQAPREALEDPSRGCTAENTLGVWLLDSVPFEEEA